MVKVISMKCQHKENNGLEFSTGKNWRQIRVHYNDNESNTNIPKVKNTGNIRRNWNEPTGVETPGHDDFNAI